MSIVRCPRCRDEVTVPAGARGRALVRCPLCLEEYLLAEALANAPPPLLIIGGEVPQEVLERQRETESAAHSEEVGEYELAASHHPSAAATVGGGAGLSTLQRPAVRGMPRYRRPQRGGLILLINYVIGGVMGLVLGLVVLWWGLHRDPLELGPPIAGYAPWLVPAEFRGKAKSNGDASGDSLAKQGPAKSAAASSTDAPPAEVKIKRNRGGKQKQSTPETKANETPTELLTLPGFGEPAKLPAAPATPSLDVPSVKEPSTEKANSKEDSAKRAAKESSPRPQPASATQEVADEAESAKNTAPERPPMPDLKGLLPD